MTSSTDTTGFDYLAMISRLDGDEELAADLLDMFVELHEDLLDRFLEAVATTNAESIRSAAHRLKGSLHEVHAMTAIKLAEQIESFAKSGDIVAAIEHSDLLEAATKSTASAISDWLASSS